MVGETEESLKHAGVSCIVGRAPYFSSARGRIIGDSDGFLKLLFRSHDMKLLGVHAIGFPGMTIAHSRFSLNSRVTICHRSSVGGVLAPI
jgi:NAD(P) transhydrogenase